MGRIVAIGMSNTDLVCRTPRLPRPGETISGRSLETFAGGKGANQAVAAVRAGAAVTFGGAVGDDAYGADRVSDLKAAGVDVALIQTVPDTASGIAIIVVDDRGENQIVTAAGANHEVDGQLLSEELRSLDYDVAIMTWELMVATSRTIIAGMRLDRPIVMTVAPFDASVADLFPDDRLIVICNAGEAAGLLGRSIPDDQQAEAAHELHALGCRAAVITLGSAGVVGHDDEGCWSVAAPDVPVVDTTGAGDAFGGAFAAWLADGSNLGEAMRAGVAAGACSVGLAGAQPSLPYRDDIVAMMERVTPERR